ncbi:MAG: DsbA family protein [Pyrinomonadaceae bacterium]
MASLTPPVNENDHVQGTSNAPIELVEYGDYQCPYCGKASSIVAAIQKALGDKLKFAFRNFPLSQIHEHALKAAIAAEAAAKQGKYWEMHEVLFENQTSLDDASLVRYASDIGLDINRFEEDFSLPDVAKKVENDFESGVRSGVNGTPSFFVNGEKYNGSWEEAPFLEFLKTLE